MSEPDKSQVVGQDLSTSQHSKDAQQTVDTITEKEEKDFYTKHPMWKELMVAMNCKIDDHIVRLLQTAGYGTYQALKDFDKEDIKFIVKFVKDGDILSRVDENDIKLYLGECKSKEKFSLTPGEVKLLLRVATYVQKNHTEPDKKLGKMTLYPIFNSKAKSSGKRSCDASPSSSKKSKTDLVTSFDMPKEVLDIKRILTAHCKKQSLPTAFSECVPNLEIQVKNVEIEDSSSLSAVITCSFCKRGQSVQRMLRETWNLSNMNRHWKNHINKDDYQPCENLKKALLSQSKMSNYVEKKSGDTGSEENSSSDDKTLSIDLTTPSKDNGNHEKACLSEEEPDFPLGGKKD